jgi:hypothetical protein
MFLSAIKEIRIYALTAILLLATGLRSQTAYFQLVSDITDSTQLAAVDYAFDTWGNYLVSSQAIKVRIAFLPLPAGILLGNAVPNGVKNFPGAPINDIWYPTSLANSIAETELNPGENDMDLFFPSGEDWYFGTDGNPGPGQFDFVSVLMHEIGHGLGVLSLANWAMETGSFGQITADNLPFAPSFDFPDLESLPSIWDYYLKDFFDHELIDEAFYINPSMELGDEFTGNAIFFDGPLARSENGGDAVRVYAPGIFAFGTSVTHIDEGSFPVSSGNSLMTPFISAGQVVHEPGDLTLAILEDLGWKITMPTGVEESSASYFSIHPNPAQGSFCTVSVSEPMPELRLIVQDMQGRPVLFQGMNNVNSSSLLLEDLSAGMYLVSLVNDQEILARESLIVLP